MKLIILFLLFSVASFAQVPAKEPAPEVVLVDPEVMPEYKGGHRAMMAYLRDSVHNKAAISLEESYIVKRAFAKFSISETGKVGEVRILRSSMVPRVDSLFKNAIEKMPDWTPGSFEGKPKRAQMYLPLKPEFH